MTKPEGPAQESHKVEALCKDCNQPENNPDYHLNASGGNWGAALHWFVPRSTPSPTQEWRTGRKVPINVYEGDRPVCQCQTALDAKKIVAAVNAAMRQVPATPACQPAGAREQGLVINESINDPALLKVIRWEIVDRNSNRAEWFALCHRREHAERIVDAVNARQQTAAKDAELKACWNQLCDIGFMFDVVTPENNLRLAEIVKHKKEAAVRERDSLRAELAALKAGKDEQK